MLRTRRSQRRYLIASGGLFLAIGGAAAGLRFSYGDPELSLADTMIWSNLIGLFGGWFSGVLWFAGPVRESDRRPAARSAKDYWNL